MPLLGKLPQPRSVRLPTLLAILLALLPDVAWTQAYPAAPIRVVVPYPPGAGTDAMARALAHQLTSDLSSPFVVENRAGANGMIGIESVVKSNPDGHTVLFTPNSPIVVGPHIYPVPYDVRKDLAPVARVATGVFVLVAHPSVPFRDVDGLVTFAKQNPGKLIFASAGSGSQAHLNLEMLRRAAAIEVVHVPYKGGGPAAVDLLGGQVQLFFEALPIMLPHIRAGKLVALGISSSERSPFLPDVPAISASIKGFNSDLGNPWYAVFAPRKTPDAMLRTLNAALHKAIRSPDLQRRLPEGGFVVAPAVGPTDFDEFLKGNYDEYGKLIRTLGLKVE